MTKKSHPPPKKIKKTRKKINRQELIEKVNVPKIVCLHLIGENHTLHHRMGVGVIVATFGVMIAHFTHGILIIDYIGELVGYTFHGIGTIPFVETYISHAKEKGQKNTGTSAQIAEELEEEQELTGERV